jgi:MFS family permease
MSKAFFVYLAIILSALAISIDFASVDLALPALERAFRLDLESVQWVLNSYMLFFAVLMVAGGKYADAYGRRRVFLIGMGIFAVASLVGGFAWSGPSVITLRALQGVGAALLWPAMIGMACAAVGSDRSSTALGIIFGTCSIGNAAGPVVGGALTEWLSWRWVLWINVPMAMLAMGMTWWAIPRDEPTGPKPRNDFGGMAALTLGLVALMTAVYQGDDWGWLDGRTLALAGVAVALLIAFPLIENRVEEPLVPPDLMKNAEFMTVCLCVIVICQLFFIVLLYFTQYAMKFLGDDAVVAGTRVVQFMLTYGAISYFGGPLTERLGARTMMLGGLVFSIAACIALGIMGAGASAIPYNLGMILLGIGVGALIPTAGAVAIETVGMERASLASGILFMAQLAGAAVLLAINTAIFAALASSALDRRTAEAGIQLDSAARQDAVNILAGAETIHQLPPSEIGKYPHLQEILTAAYGEGLAGVLFISAGLAFVGLLLALRFVKADDAGRQSTPPSRPDAASPTPAPSS